jgi:hypothetical protein
MNEIQFHGRRAVQIENGPVRVTVTIEGGHIAEILDKASGVNPLWIPPWPSIEPTSYRLEQHPEYGNDAESRLLSGIMGHNLCLDMFGAPSPEEAAAGMVVHGETNLSPWEIETSHSALSARVTLPIAQLGFERRIRIVGRRVQVRETVRNLIPLDRPIAWTQHVTLGPPFLDPATTQFRVPSARSEALAGSTEASGYTTHLAKPEDGRGWFVAYSPESRIAFGYSWSVKDFPWLGIWHENRGRTHAPWNGRTVTRGMEFGASPVPESRRKMIDRGRMFDTPGFRWAPAKSEITAEYYAGIAQSAALPSGLAEFDALTI